MSKRKYGHQLAIAFDQLLNALLAGHADETLSARAWRMSELVLPTKRRWRIMRKVINGIFFWQKDHCYNSYLSEFEQKHFPSHYRE